MMRLKRKDVETAREIGLWITKIIVPSAFILYWCPEVRYFLAHIWATTVNKLQELYYKAKTKIKETFIKLKK